MTQGRRKEGAEKRVVAEFERRRSKITRWAIVFGVVVAAVIIMSYQGGISKTMTAVLLVVSFVWALAVHAKIWRCPSCNGHLGKLYLGLKLPKHCPHCGICLIEERK